MKVLITPRSFGQYDDMPRKNLLDAGIEIVENPKGGILTKEEMIELCSDVDAVILGVDPMDKDVMDAAPKLKIISKYGVGIDNIDMDYAKEKDIEVTITRGANSEAVADFAFTLLLAVARRLVEINAGCHENDWSKKVSLDIYGKKIGVLGLGAIGRGVIQRAKGFNMEVYGYDVVCDSQYIEENGVHFTDLKTICETCDFISVHLPLLDTTHHIIDKDMIALMKKNVILVNTARGGTIDETALYDALKAKQVYGAGLDVFETEPAYTSPLLELDNVIAGSHCSASSEGAVIAMSTQAVENVLSHLGGQNG
jgi:Lactate dehydrogenase and related dehydrogenases